MKKETIKISQHEEEVLEFLAGASSDCSQCSYFIQISEGTGLDVKLVRRSCRSLRRKGLVEFWRGLMTDDNEVAGSGYCISDKGKARLNPCDHCSNEAWYEYDGKNECRDHYKKP